MSVSTKRELDSPTQDSTSSKKRKPNAPEKEVRDRTEDGPSDKTSYNPKNLLKSGVIPTGQAYAHKTLTLDLYIPPIDASDPMFGVERQLDDVLLTYLKDASGILMGWRDPVFTSPVARVLEESPFSFTQVQVETVIWRPKRGEDLEGQIKFMGPSHIGILILGTFNASVPLPLIPPDWRFEENFEGDDGFWIDGDGTQLSIDSTLRFKTVNIMKGANILSVEGSLLDRVTQPKHEDGADATAVEVAVKHKKQGHRKPAIANGPTPIKVEEVEEEKVKVNGNAKLSKAERKAEKEKRKLEKRALKEKRKSKS